MKHNLGLHMLVCVLLTVVSPLFMGIENLPETSVAKIMEVYLSLIGLILLVPTFLPDMNKDIRDLIYSKKEPAAVLHCIRVLEAVAVMVMIGILFLSLLKAGNCQFHFKTMFYTLMANGLFLGGMGMLVFAFFEQPVFSYMIPMVYYVVNYGAGRKQLGKFWLFSMQGGSIEEKHYLISAGLLFIVGAIIIRKLKNMRRR